MALNRIERQSQGCLFKFIFFYFIVVYSSSHNDYATRHSHSVTTNASTTGSKGSGTAIDMRPRRLNSVVWRRVS